METTTSWRPRARRGGVAALCAIATLGCSGPSPDEYTGFVDAPVAAVASPVAGQVVHVLVHEGDRVHRGDLLVELDPRERDAMLGQAQAGVEHARAMLLQAEHEAQAIEPTVLSAEADIARQQAELDDASAELGRAQTLASTGVFTASQLDAARARFAAAEATVRGGGAARHATRARVVAGLAGVRTARAALASSRATLALAQVQVDEAQIRAPFDGIVAERNVREGEWAAPGTPVVTIEDTSSTWVRIDVEETAFGRLALGAPADVRIVALPDRVLHGRVIEIGAEGEFAIDRDVRRGRPDVRTFRVRVLLDATEQDVRPGMTASVTLHAAGGPAERATRSSAVLARPPAEPIDAGVAP